MVLLLHHMFPRLKGGWKERGVTNALNNVAGRGMNKKKNTTRDFASPPSGGAEPRGQRSWTNTSRQQSGFGCLICLSDDGIKFLVFGKVK